MWYVWETRDVLTGFRWGYPIERDYLEETVDGKIVLKRISKKCEARAWSWLFWIGIRIVSGRLGMWWWTFGYHKMRANSWLAEDLSASQKRLSSMKFLLMCNFAIHVAIFAITFMCGCRTPLICPTLYVSTDTARCDAIPYAGAKTFLMVPILFVYSN